MTEFHVVIPARFASTRLPGKPLLTLAGRPMLAHVYDRACDSGAGRVIIATDDARILEMAHSIGAEALLTRADHASGTDRIQEVAAFAGWADEVCVVNVQGDEPLLPAELINQVAANLEAHPEASIATLAEPITDWATLLNPNAVKVVCDEQGVALYFSRSPIPWDRNSAMNPEFPFPKKADYLRHIGLYAYRTGFLHEFVRRIPARLEQVECLEQLRALAAGARIHVAPAAVPFPVGGVDTPEDLLRVRRLLGEML